MPVNSFSRFWMLSNISMTWELCIETSRFVFFLIVWHETEKCVLELILASKYMFLVFLIVVLDFMSVLYWHFKSCIVTRELSFLFMYSGQEWLNELFYMSALHHSQRICSTTAWRKTPKSWSATSGCLKSRALAVWCPQPAELPDMSVNKLPTFSNSKIQKCIFIPNVVHD